MCRVIVEFVVVFINVGYASVCIQWRFYECGELVGAQDEIYVDVFG